MLSQMSIAAPSLFALTGEVPLSGIPYKVQLRKKRIISELSRKEEVTINEISDLLNISVPTATELMLSLIEEGFVKDTGKKSEGVGRKASIFALAENSFFFVGVEIRKYKLNIGLMGFDKKMVASSLNIPFPFLDTHESLEEIIKHIKLFLDSITVPRDRILGIGLSISGRINVKTGVI